MLNESRRRDYLSAMQVVSWLPRTELPFAAPSRPQLLEWTPEPELAPVNSPAAAPASSPNGAVSGSAAAVAAPQARQPSERPKIEVPRPSAVAPKATRRPLASKDDPESAPTPKAPVIPPPRFALQLLRAGHCLLLVELSTGQPFQSRDPSYLLLKDMLRAAGLPDSPQIIGEPVRWPLLVRGQMDQGPEAARDFVQGFVAARLEDQPCVCLWLIGLPAVRFAGEADGEAFYRELQVEGLGSAWALPSLEQLMDEPQRKADVWQAMRRLMTRWNTINE